MNTLSRHSWFLGCLFLAGVAWGEPLATAKALASAKTKDGWIYKLHGKSSRKESDCTQFLQEVIEKEIGRKLSPEESRLLHIRSWNAGTVQAALAAAESDPATADLRLDGVVRMLEVSNLGKRVPVSDARPGDFIQYWVQRPDGKTWAGHCGVIATISNGHAVLLGAHAAAGPEGNFGPARQAFDLQGRKRRVALGRLESR